MNQIDSVFVRVLEYLCVIALTHAVIGVVWLLFRPNSSDRKDVASVVQFLSMALLLSIAFGVAAITIVAIERFNK